MRGPSLFVPDRALAGVLGSSRRVRYLRAMSRRREGRSRGLHRRDAGADTHTRDLMANGDRSLRTGRNAGCCVVDLAIER